MTFFAIMAAVTECALIPMRSGARVEDDTTTEGSVLAAMLRAGQIEPTVQKNYWGRELENQCNLHLMLGMMCSYPNNQET